MYEYNYVPCWIYGPAISTGCRESLYALNIEVDLMFDSEETPKKEPVATAAAAAAESGDADTSAAAAPGAGDAAGDAAGDTAGAEAPASPAAAAPLSSSSPPSPTVTSPPMSPQRQLEARSADEMTTSVVRCLAFAETFLLNGKCCCK